jgi:hypothetical protein
MQRYQRCTSGLFLLLGAMALPCSGATVTLTAIDSGFYASDGSHTTTNENYLTGQLTNERRSFFVFDLSGVSGTIQSATLRLFNPEVSAFLHGYVSPSPTETLNIYDVTTAAGSITDGTAGVAGFADLGSGSVYGTRSVSAADNGTAVEIALNSAAIAGMQSATGLFLLGGALSSISGPADQYVFGFSMAGFVTDHTRELVLDVAPAAVPEPGTVIYGLVGLGLVLVGRRKLVS